MLKRTTHFIEEETLEDIRRMAREQATSTADVVRQALKDYINKNQIQRPGFSFMAIGRSGRHDTSERIDELLWQDSRTARLIKKRNKR